MHRNLACLGVVFPEEYRIRSPDVDDQIELLNRRIHGLSDDRIAQMALLYPIGKACN